MPFTLTIRPPVLFASWRGFTVAELREVGDGVADLRRTSGHRVVYLSRIPAGAHVFTDEEQKVLVAFLNTILPHCSTIHHVVEGDGFQRATRLATITNMARATPRPRDFHTHETVEEAKRSIKAIHGVDLGDGTSRVSGPPPERASGAFREAVRLVEGGRPPPPRKV